MIFRLPVEFAEEAEVDDRIVELVLLLSPSASFARRRQSRHFPFTGLVAVRTLQPNRPGGTLGGLVGRKTDSWRAWSSSIQHLLATWQREVF